MLHQFVIISLEEQIPKVACTKRETLPTVLRGWVGYTASQALNDVKLTI